MAKAKPDKPKDPRETAATLIKKHEKHLVQTAAQFVAKPITLVSMSPAIDLQIGGGTPKGSFVLLAGPRKCGKTITMLQFASNAIKLGMKVFYLNIEGRLKHRDLLGITGLDLDKLHIVGSFKTDKDEGGKVDGKILTGEEWVSLGEYYMHEHPGCMVVFDSFSQLATEKEMTVQIGDRPGDGAYRLLAQFTKRNATIIPVNEVIVVGSVHIIANTNPNTSKFKSKVRSGGNKIEYAVDVDLECYQVVPWLEDGDDPIGQYVHWKTNSTAILPPGRKIKGMLRYGIGLDESAEYFELGRSLGFITASGAWYTLDYMRRYEKELGMKWVETTDKKGKVKLDPKLSPLVFAQGQEKLLTLMRDNPKYLGCLRKEISGMLGYESS